MSNVLDFSNFSKNFNFVLMKEKTSDYYLSLRSSINSPEEAIEFVKKFGEKTKTNWVFYRDASSAKWIFHKTWLCHHSWLNKIASTSRGKNCHARIVIFVKNENHFLGRRDKYLNCQPPLLCEIEIGINHSHGTGVENFYDLAFLTEEVKTEFYQYFQNGLDVNKAKQEYEVQCKLRDKGRVHKTKIYPTLRQTQLLYDYWCLKHDIKNTDKSNTSEILTTTTACPSRKEIYLPLIFTPLETIPTIPNGVGPLIFELKQRSYLPCYIPHPTSSICIESLSESEQFSSAGAVSTKNSSSSIPTPMEITIKEEPMDSEDESFGNAVSEFSKGSDTQNVFVKTEEQKTRIEDFRLPLNFVSIGSDDFLKYKDFSYMYALQYGPKGEYASLNTLPKIISVALNSPNEIILGVLINSNSGNAYGNVEKWPLEGIHIQVIDANHETHNTNESLQNSSIDIKPSIFPVILDVSSCGTNKTTNKSFELQCDTSITGASGSNEPTDKKTQHTQTPKDATLKDPDYQFLMSLLPELKKFSPELKTEVKKKMKNFITTTQLCASRLNFEKRRSNVYRDCGVIPTVRDWKF